MPDWNYSDCKNIIREAEADIQRLEAEMSVTKKKLRRNLLKARILNRQSIISYHQALISQLIK